MISELFIFLVFVHFVADFALQSEFMAKYKQESWFIMTVHCIIWTGSIILALMWYKGFHHLSEVSGLVSIWLLYVGHYLCDSFKCYFINGTEWGKRNIKHLFHADQVFHLIQLLIVACIYG